MGWGGGVAPVPGGMPNKVGVSPQRASAPPPSEMYMFGSEEDMDCDVEDMGLLPYVAVSGVSSKVHWVGCVPEPPDEEEVEEVAEEDASEATQSERGDDSGTESEGPAEDVKVGVKSRSPSPSHTALPRIAWRARFPLFSCARGTDGTT